MKIGLALPAYDLETLRPLTTGEILSEALRAEAQGFDSIWLMDHYFMVRGRHRVAGHEPLVTLAHIASQTSRIALGVMVLCNGFRTTPQLAREAAALADASAGRFILGLGCGSQPAEHEAFGIPFDHRVSRLEESLAVLKPLMSGSAVDHKGRYSSLEAAAIATTAPPPPVWVAAFGPRMMALAARYADGHITAWHGPDPAAFIAHRDGLRAALSAAGRPAPAVEVVAGILALPARSAEVEGVMRRAAGLAPSAGDRIEDRVIVGGVDRIAEALAGYAELGVDHAVIAMSPWQFGRFEPDAADRLAGVIERLR
ncbi:MAG TPA: LLM class flavin-dependent oxidoreductase [Candidatus Dormibacteraeota bacterium]